MIKVENVSVFGWEAAIRGMRNPMNSWDKSDSYYCDGNDCPHVDFDTEPAIPCVGTNIHDYCIGKNDLKLMRNLAKAGSDHAKYLRMINVSMDITAPLYWWKEFDTYKVGTVANSCSTMHKIHAKEFTLDDFSHERLVKYSVEPTFPHGVPLENLCEIIDTLNYCRKQYVKTNDKDWWWQMIQLLPSSYNQRRTVQMNYQVCWNMYRARKNHKLDEWRTLCCGFEKLPYFREIFLGG